MASGGARTRSGPAPDPNALARERDAKDWLRLPAVRVDAPAPEWPLPDSTERELDLWARLWRLPQSVLWRRNAQDLEVAVHARTQAEAEERGASSAQRTLLRQQADALLLTIPAMRAARVEIVPVDQAPVSAGRGAAANRDRLKVLRGGDA